MDSTTDLLSISGLTAGLMLILSSNLPLNCLWTGDLTSFSPLEAHQGPRLPISPHLPPSVGEKIQSRRSVSPFHQLPSELQLLILSHCPKMLPLLQVSRAFHCLTLATFLPILPIALVTSRKTASFSAFLKRYPGSSQLVRHLWVMHTAGDAFHSSAEIIRTCKGLRNLACTAQMFRASIGQSPELQHVSCKSFTLLTSSTGWENAFREGCGVEFLKRLTHLRIIGNFHVPEGVSFEMLTRLSLSCNVGRTAVVKAMAEAALACPDRLPALRVVVLTRASGVPALTQTREEAGEKLVTLCIPRDRKEVELWSDGVRGEGIWSTIK